MALMKLQREFSDMGYADGGEVTEVPMEDMSTTSPENLTEEELAILDEALNMHEGLEDIIEKLVNITGEGEFDGPIEGPGTGTSDSIDAKLSDGEFVFTAKAVKQIGVDKLRKMMAKAEEDYDSALTEQTQQQVEGPAFKRGGLLTKPEHCK